MASKMNKITIIKYFCERQFQENTDIKASSGRSQQQQKIHPWFLQFKIFFINRVYLFRIPKHQFLVSLLQGREKFKLSRLPEPKGMVFGRWSVIKISQDRKIILT